MYILTSNYRGVQSGRSYSYCKPDGQQYSTRGHFLILMQSDDEPCGPENFRGIIRKVAMKQLGHFMMGTARIKNHSITLSGVYGCDGLPVTVPEEVYQMGVDIPHDLYKVWSKGGGWNSCGSEAEAMQQWARKTFKKELSK